ncbi:hypothetical protein KJ866_04720 [Patescibacteria group bacterium]|nr:hypothetical protein [Patescibacteria group bacterium]
METLSVILAAFILLMVFLISPYLNKKTKISLLDNPFIVILTSVGLTAMLYGDWRSGGFILFIDSIFIIGTYSGIKDF